MLTKEIVISDINKKYKHPLAELVQLACQYNSEILLTCGNMKVNAKSIMGIFAFSPLAGDTVTISTSGQDESDAIGAIENFLLCE